MTPRKILAMHTGGWIGDMILLTPALRALRKKLPEAHISMLVRPLVQDLMERNPHLDEVIVYDKRGAHKGIRQMWRMAERLNAEQFDTAVILHPNSVRSALLAFTAAIPERVGAVVRGRELLLTTKIENRTDVHEVQRYLNVVSPIVGADPPPRVRGGYAGGRKLEFWGIDRDDEDCMDHTLADLPRPIIGINPCTTWPSKQWPAERFARLAYIISHQLGASVLFTGGPGDLHLGDDIMERIGTRHDLPILNFIGHTTLWQLGALIKRCNLYITCDSGPMHISAAVDTSTIALFGPTDPARHSPYGAGHIVIRKDVRCSPCYQRECKSRDCMNAIQVEDVMAFVKENWS